MIEYGKLRDAEIFKSLPDHILQELARHCRYQELPAGEMLFEQNSPGDSVYLLETGQIHVVRQYPDGEQVILATEGPYYVIGELSMLAEQPRTGAVVAVSDCTLIALDRQIFLEVCQRMPALAMSLLAHMGLRLYRMNLQVREAAIGNVAARVASVLLLLAECSSDLVDVELHISRVARAAATDSDVVERLLQNWARQGYIEYDARHVTIRQIDTLRGIAG